VVLPLYRVAASRRCLLPLILSLPLNLTLPLILSLIPGAVAGR